MYEFLKVHQLNIMLGLSSVCLMVGLFALITRSLPKRRKFALAYIEFSASLLLFFDRLSYMYSGNPGRVAFWMIRISNFIVFFMTICVIHSFNIYLMDLCRNEIGLKKIPRRLRFVEIVVGIGHLVLIISQFTGLYYYFDDNNTYHRGPGFIICYIIPILGTLIPLTVIIQYAKRMSLSISIPLLLFGVAPIVASIFQFFFYGISLTNIMIVGMGVVIYIFAIMELDEKLEKAQREQLNDARDMGRSVTKSFEEIITSFSKAVDSRNKYRKNHSVRVAEYSMEIAQTLGMDEKSCQEVYYSAILHDIGKILVPDSIIQQTERLTSSERAIFRKHTINGGDILAAVEEMPFLKTAALYHHERYDGMGYPEGLSGENIPVIARIVAVADAYDELTCTQSSHPAFAQGKVRDTLISGAGKEFDPRIVEIMVGMIDRDTEYVMREADDDGLDEFDKNDIRVVKRMHFGEYKEQVSDGIRITKEFLKIKFDARPDVGYDRAISMPSIILFDSFDRCVHRNERGIKNSRYYEFGEIWMDGHTISTAARNIKSDVHSKVSADYIDENEWITYEIEAINIKDHVGIKINNIYMSADITVALPDATRFVFLGITGENCSIKNISVSEIPLEVNNDYIRRIAPEVNYFTRKDGDIPNIEINGYREVSTAGLPVEDDMRVYFHTNSLPVSHLVNHCAFVVIFTSDDGTVKGKNYKEFACIRMDGEDATNEGVAENKLIVHKSDDFVGWDAWKEIYKKGLDYELRFYRKKNRIIFKTENAGISIECTTTVPKGEDNVYVAFTGNLCVIMNIRIR